MFASSVPIVGLNFCSTSAILGIVYRFVSALLSWRNKRNSPVNNDMIATIITVMLSGSIYQNKKLIGIAVYTQKLKQNDCMA